MPALFCPRQRTTQAARAQRGAATLVVVMVLFFVISLVAAYAGRNIIFEQRTSANQLQGTVSFEAADAGLEWALSLLNSARIDTNCEPSASLADTTFRQRYLSVDASSGLVTVPLVVRNGPAWPSCSANGGAWTCSCPTAAAPTLPPGAATGMTPSFRVRFVQYKEPTPDRAGIVRVEVNGCTQPDDACLNFRPANANFCRGTVCALVALHPGLKSAPVAAVTARQSVDVGGAALSVYNTAPKGEGITILAGGAVNTTNVILRGPPGTPRDLTVAANDTSLAAAAFTADRMFASSFGVWRETYWQQPAAVRLCAGGPCNATAIRDAAALNPGRVLIADGDLVLDGGADIGSDAEPVVLVVKGNLSFSAPTNVIGMVYAETADLVTSAGAGLIRGALVAEGQISGGGDFTVVYDPDVLAKLRWATGSFVKVPGSWRDFE